MNSTQVSTVSRAITLIGFDSVKSMAISSLIVDSMLKRNDRPHLLRCLARAIGMQRVALLMTDRQGYRLVPRKVGGRGTEEWREKFIINKDGTGPLGELLPHGISGVFKPGKQAEGVSYDRWLGKVPALVGSLTAKGRLVGLFYADNAAAGYVPSKQQEETFAHFIQNAQLCLALMSAR